MRAPIPGATSEKTTPVVRKGGRGFFVNSDRDRFRRSHVLRTGTTTGPEQPTGRPVVANGSGPGPSPSRARPVSTARPVTPIEPEPGSTRWTAPETGRARTSHPRETSTAYRPVR